VGSGNGGAECEGDEDCEDGYRGQSGYCLPEVSDSCMIDTDCPDGLHCDGGRCLPEGIDGCEDDEDCDENQTCVATFCVDSGTPVRKVALRRDEDCEEGRPSADFLLAAAKLRRMRRRHGLRRRSALRLGA
jgi:hypothetical protein